MKNETTGTDKWRLFADLSAQEVELVQRACQKKVLVAGEDLFCENDEGASLFIVQSGRVEIFKNIRGDLDRSLASMGPGEVLGEMSFVDASRRSAGARTTEPSEFLVLERKAFEARVEREQPTVAARVYRNLAAIMAMRVRNATDLYKEQVAFNLEATGAQVLTIKGLGDDLSRVTVHLPGGSAVQGRVMQLDHHPAGYTLVLMDKSRKVTLIPYHAIQRIEVDA